MPVAKLTLEVEIPHAQSLKDRRQVVRSMKDRLRRNFNVSVAEIDEALVWNRASLEVVAVSRSVSYLTGLMALLERAATGVAIKTGAVLSDVFAELLEESGGEPLPPPQGGPPDDPTDPSPDDRPFDPPAFDPAPLDPPPGPLPSHDRPSPPRPLAGSTPPGTPRNL